MELSSECWSLELHLSSTCSMGVCWSHLWGCLIQAAVWGECFAGRKRWCFCDLHSATYKSRKAAKSPRYHKVRDCKMCCGALRWSSPDRSACPLEKLYKRVQCAGEARGWILLPVFPLKRSCKFCSRRSRKGQWLEGNYSGYGDIKSSVHLFVSVITVTMCCIGLIWCHRLLSWCLHKHHLPPGCGLYTAHVFQLISLQGGSWV